MDVNAEVDTEGAVAVKGVADSAVAVGIAKKAVSSQVNLWQYCSWQCRSKQRHTVHLSLRETVEVLLFISFDIYGA